MKFSEEYKSAMNEIAPDEKLATRIESAVMAENAQKPVKYTRKKPIFIGTAVSGAAVCAAIACFVVFGNSRLMSGSSGSSTVINTANTNAAVQDSEKISEIGSVTEDYYSSSSMYFSTRSELKEELPSAMPSDDGTKSEDMNAVTDDANYGETGIFTLEFLPDGGIVVKCGDYLGEFEQAGIVKRYSEPQKNLTSAITEDGTQVFILIEGNKLYLFDDDLQTAEQYNKKRSD